MISFIIYSLIISFCALKYSQRKTEEKRNSQKFRFQHSFLKKERIKGIGFASVSSYVTYMLKELSPEEDKLSYSKEDKKIKARVRALGYANI